MGLPLRLNAASPLPVFSLQASSASVAASAEGALALPQPEAECVAADAPLAEAACAAAGAPLAEASAAAAEVQAGSVVPQADDYFVEAAELDELPLDDYWVVRPAADSSRDDLGLAPDALAAARDDCSAALVQGWRDDSSPADSASPLDGWPVLLALADYWAASLPVDYSVAPAAQAARQDVP